MQLDFFTCDVFTTRPFGGNPLAVVMDAEHLTTAQMQSICREFNLSETAFVMAPDDPANTAKVRIFFPGGEMPFAGHPTIGTAILLAELRQKEACNFETTLRLELAAGLTSVKVTRIGGISTATLVSPRLPELSVRDVPPIAEMARALNIEVADIGFGRHRPAFTRGAIGFLVVPVKSRAALAASRIIESCWSAIVRATHDLDAVYLYTAGGDHPDTRYRARMYAPAGGIPEDPATGSATVQMAAQLLAAEGLADGTHRWRFEQGYEMGRPSDLFLAADVRGGRLTEVRLAGQAVQIMEGVLNI